MPAKLKTMKNLRNISIALSLTFVLVLGSAFSIQKDSFNDAPNLSTLSTESDITAAISTYRARAKTLVMQADINLALQEVALVRIYKGIPVIKHIRFELHAKPFPYLHISRKISLSKGIKTWRIAQ